MLSLNLIPPKAKAENQLSANLQRWQTAVFVLAAFVIIGTAGSVTLWQVLARHGRSVNAELHSLQVAGAGTGVDITSTTSKLNTTIQTLTTTLGSPQNWPEVTRVVLDILPTGADVTELTISPAGAFHLTGTADSRQTFVNLEQLLKSNPRLAKVVTASTASKRTDVPFDFTGSILPLTPTP